MTLKINAYNVNAGDIPFPTLNDSGKFLYFDGTQAKWQPNILNKDITECTITDYINSNNFSNLPNLRKVYISSTCRINWVNRVDKSPFYGCSSSVRIYTDVIDSSHIPEDWGQYWNNYDDTNKLTVYYNSSLKTYKEY